MIERIQELLGKDAKDLLEHRCETIPQTSLHLPGPDFIDRIFGPSDRSPRVLGNLARMFTHGRLSGTGFLSILPLGQAITSILVCKIRYFPLHPRIARQSDSQTQI